MKSIVKIYNKFFYFIAKNRLKNKDLDPSSIHRHNIVVLMTGLLMWAYAFLAYYTISHPLPGIIGFLCAIIHLLSPLLFRLTPNINLICAVMLTSGITHQGTFAFFTGGFNSHILIWYAIIPSLAGIITNNKGIIVWFSIVTSVALAFFGLELMQYPFPNLISKNGFLMAQVLLVFGWIATASVILFVYNAIVKSNENKIAVEKNKLDGLLKILVHDFSNSIHVLKSTSSILLNQAKGRKEETDTKSLKFLHTLKKHTDFLSETTSSIKAMYLMNENINEVILQEVELNQSISMITSILEDKLEQKSIKLNYDYQENEGLFVQAAPQIFENQVLQNLLTNAIKFSQIGGEIDIIVNKEQQDQLRLTIKDYGVGIPPNILEKIFDASAKTSRPGTENEPGTGLGMSILKTFAEKMRFKIEINSELNQGTAVTLVIPKSSQA